MQEIVKKAISDTIVEYTISQPTKDIVTDFINSILAYNSATAFTKIVIDIIDREINAAENPAIIYSFLMDILYKINLDLIELNLDSERVVTIDIFINSIKNTHSIALEDSAIVTNEAYPLYEPTKEIGMLDVIIYLLIQNKFKLIELLKTL